MPSSEPKKRELWLPAILAWAAAPALYLSAMFAAAVMERQPVARVLCFDLWTDAPPALPRLIVAALAAVGAVAVLFVVPWVLGVGSCQRLAGPRRAAGAWSLAGNSVALVLVCLVLRHTAGIHRGTFFAAWLLWTAVLLWAAGGPAAAWRDAARLARQWNLAILVGLAAVIVGIAVLGRQQFGQCFEGDGAEVFELARSLRHHFLPYWQVEALGRFGNPVVYPAMIDSYWTMAMQVLLGEGEFSTRLMYWVWWLGIFAVAVQMIGGSDGIRDWGLGIRSEDGRRKTEDGCSASVVRAPSSVVDVTSSPPHPLTSSPCHLVTLSPSWLPAVPLALAVVLIALWYTFYTGYYPYMTDLASPGVPDGMLIILILLAMNCLRQGDVAGWAVTLAICGLTSYAGPVMFVLSAAAALVWRPVPARRMLRGALWGGSLLAAIAAAYLAWGWWQGLLAAWLNTLVHESFEGYYTAEIHHSASAAEYLLYFLVGSGGFALLGLLLPFFQRAGRDDAESADGEARPLAWRQTVAMAALGYFLIVLGARCRNLHYLGPVLLVPLVLWLHATARLKAAKTLLAATTLSLVACFALCWPTSWGQFTLNHELGAATTFVTDSYEEAMSWSGLVDSLRNQQPPLISWRVDRDTWATYAERSPRPATWRPLVVTKGPPPAPGYLLVAESDGVKLYCRDASWAAWLVSQHPANARSRVPWVLRATAIEEK
jgi:hypothetical protein